MTPQLDIFWRLTSIISSICTIYTQIYHWQQPKRKSVFSGSGNIRGARWNCCEQKHFPQKNKLIQTLHKTNYTLHHLNLKLHYELGLEVTKIHRVSQFDRSKWLKPYIQLNTTKRKASANKFEKFYKRWVTQHSEKSWKVNEKDWLLKWLVQGASCSQKRTRCRWKHTG